jgi:hypothetical protein
MWGGSRSNYDPLRSYISGSNDTILNEVGRTTAVSLVGVHHGPEGTSGHTFGTPPRGLTEQCQSQGLAQYDNPGLAAKLPWGQWRLTIGASHVAALLTLRYYYGLPGTNAGEHSYGGSFGYLSWFQPDRKGGLICYTDCSKTKKGTAAEMYCYGTRQKLSFSPGQYTTVCH